MSPRPLPAWFRLVRRGLRGRARDRRSYRPAVEIEAARAAWWLMRAYYLFTLSIAFASLREMYRLAISGRTMDPLWPVLWIGSLDRVTVAGVLGLALLASAVLAIGWPARRWPRISVAVLYLMCLAYENSFGSINHYGHAWLWCAIGFAALPPIQPERLVTDRRQRQQLLFGFFATQCLIALFYTMSGAFKAVAGIVVLPGNVSSFAPEALPLLVVQRWLEGGRTPLLADVFLAHQWLAWPAQLMVIYVELFALVAMFRPQLHRLWGLSLALFHLAVWLVLGISFPYQPLIVALLFFCSPLQPRPTPSVGQIVRQLPGVGLGALIVNRLPGLAPSAP